METFLRALKFPSSSLMDSAWFAILIRPRNTSHLFQSLLCQLPLGLQNQVHDSHATSPVVAYVNLPMASPAWGLAEHRTQQIPVGWLSLVVVLCFLFVCLFVEV